MKTLYRPYWSRYWVALASALFATSRVVLILWRIKGNGRIVSGMQRNSRVVCFIGNSGFAYYYASKADLHRIKDQKCGDKC